MKEEEPNKQGEKSPFSPDYAVLDEIAKCHIEMNRLSDKYSRVLQNEGNEDHLPLPQIYYRDLEELDEFRKNLYIHGKIER